MPPAHQLFSVLPISDDLVVVKTFVGLDYRSFTWSWLVDDTDSNISKSLTISVRAHEDLVTDTEGQLLEGTLVLYLVYKGHKRIAVRWIKSIDIACV